MRALGRRRRAAILERIDLESVARSYDPSGYVPGLPGWTCVPTPGHTPGHVSFLRLTDRVLVTGDALVTLQVNSVSGLLAAREGLSGPPRYTTWDWRRAKSSVAALARLEPLVLAGGHGTPLRGPGTAAAVRAFAERFAGPDATGRAAG